LSVKAPNCDDNNEIATLPENDCVRYSIFAATRKELPKRLLAGNHRRAAAESAQTLPPTASRKRTRTAEHSETKPMFDD
jgi:hypothetical protein